MKNKLLNNLQQRARNFCSIYVGKTISAVLYRNKHFFFSIKWCVRKRREGVRCGSIGLKGGEEARREKGKRGGPRSHRSEQRRGAKSIRTNLLIVPTYGDTISPGSMEHNI